MAATAEAARLTEAHRLAQQRIGMTTVAQMLAAWRLLDPEELDRTIEQWLDVVGPLVRAGRRDSARLAANYLTAFRTLELGITPGRFAPAIAEELPFRQLATSLIVTGPGTIRDGLAHGRRLADIVDVAQAKSAGAAMRHTINGGRQSIIDTVVEDRRALGWARTVSGRPCAFCAMLASRGPVYKGGSFDASDVRFHGVGEAKVHDHCSCGVEPVYRADADWPAGGRRWGQLWQESTRGLSGDDARDAFRSALEAQR